ncbi:MAG TPA: phosphoribosylformylglycinamidine synthase subunit PurQ [Spirochaetales bacterium]|nr:phosphoribosylformylglycinamidine synthase subunit PurQ [Spirochaetales bacterium]HRY55034.1 phosphoribosylformylglycinamidine synthase subunit PurQ [Spirochaetia bacterium]HRZ63945.1 phosphoribosylformylglycinamidine synthase subunit PurQ [Spirochaetia bacterium]
MNAQVKAIVVSGYGFNADAELAEAFRLAGALPERVHLADLLAEPGRLDGAGLLGFPGGFSFGDHLGSGQLVALLCRRSLRPALESFVARGGLAIGICNGFQSLARMGMLPNRAGSWEREASLVANASGRFVDTWVKVRFEPGCRSPWTRGLPDRMLPVRHGEGRFVMRAPAPRKPNPLDELEAEGLVALRYDPAEDPNGSERRIAGVCDPTGRVLGLMPHPEAFLFRENHPLRRRGSADRPGLDLFENGVAAARAAT